MRKNFIVNRDINEIEKELNNSFAGVLTLRLKGGGNYQIATNFIYLDKNIFIALNKEDEKFESIKFNHYGQFLVYNAHFENDSDYSYQIKYISIVGEFRELDDPKQIEQVKEKFYQKFSKDVKESDYIIPSNLKLCILDSKEIQFIIENGK
jgi:nitroimidazol reductase NimA-like FMN-containing flavoprotein (pyridoxamine 5'-phosphate oxidase superfamily)